jgi:metal-sulfur cluster biosynthetic enzyme
MIAEAPAVAEATVLAALRHVNDPELDESLVELGFVDSVSVDGDRVDLVLRLPTFWCAPNFAYLMAHDARQAVLGVDGVREVRVVLKDHMYSDEITSGVSAGKSFDHVFEGQTENEDIEGLRRVFYAKAFGMRQEQLVRALFQDGLTQAEVVGLRVGDLVDVSDRSGLRLTIHGEARVVRGAAPLARAYLSRRERLGLSVAAEACLITRVDGRAIHPDNLDVYLQQTRKQRISMTFNALMCRGLLETRYGLEPSRKEDRR